MIHSAAADVGRRTNPRATGEQRRIIVVSVARAGADVISRFRHLAYDVMPIEIAPSLVSDVVSGEADVVVVVHDAGSFDLVRVCRVLRDSIESRIIVVAGGAEVHDDFVVEVLDAGADDYVEHDIPDAVLAAKARVALRATPRRVRVSPRLSIGDLVIDAEAHIVTIADQVVKVPPLQFQLLLLLARHPGVLVHRDRIVTELWGAQAGAFNPRRLRVAVSVLRRILGEGPLRPTIETAAYVGYRLSPAPSGD